MIKSNTRRHNEMPFVETRMKISKTKSLERANKNNISVNAIEESQFLQSEVISDVRGNEALNAILQVNCQECRSKPFSTETDSNICLKFPEDVNFDSELEQRNQRSFRELDNTITMGNELIPD
ncbi:hypothetical protein AVEN_265305-1 [Araneus ventricosus]|uniref:Uncharacterized protein n=1 Tax=Araneus ventricosus TaxID=182803 RepID=A0A4Y2ELN6_ARAVE|nr:hypothetical protein AVEN_265305-1 [Araneus ventricosus]